MKKLKIILGAVLCGLSVLAAVFGIWLALSNRQAEPVMVQEDPEARIAVQKLLDAVCAGKYANAEKLMLDQPQLGLNREAEEALGKLLWDAYQESLSFTAVGEVHLTDHGVAYDYTASRLDLDSVTANLHERSQAMLAKRVEEAEDMSQVYDENNDYRLDFVMDVLQQAAEEALVEDAQYVEQDVTISMVYQDGMWRAMPDSIVDALYGNFTGNNSEQGTPSAEKLGFVLGKNYIYWSSVVLAIAAVVTILMFFGLRIAAGENMTGLFLVLPFGVLLSMVLGRLVHWYCNPDSYASFVAAITDYTSGNYALMGVFAGCILTICVIWMLGLIDDITGTLDCMAIAGALGMAVGRLNHLFNNIDRGKIVMDGVKSLPLAYPMESLDHDVQYPLATFMLQAIVAAILFAVLVSFYARKGKYRKGDTCLLFLLCHGASQILLDSTRYDPLFMRSNGFIGLVQIMGAVLVVLTVVLFSVRLVKNRGWRWWYVLLWVAVVGLLTCAGIMEYLVQRRGNEALKFYAIMGTSLAGIVAVGVALCSMSDKMKLGKYER